MKETSPGRARNRSFLAPTSGGNSFLRRNKSCVSFFTRFMQKKVIYCNLLSMSYRGIFSPGHKVERHPGPDRHLGHLQQVRSPGGWTEEKQVFKVKVCYNRLQKQADRHKHTNLKVEEQTLFCSFRSTSACEVHQTWNGPWNIVGKKISKTKSYIWIFVDIW